MKESAQLALSWLRSRSVEVNGPWFALTVDNRWLGTFFLIINSGRRRNYFSFLLAWLAQVLKSLIA